MTSPAPYILTARTMLPEHYYSQDELISALKDLWAARFFNLDRLERFHRNVLVGGRHMALPLDEYRQLKGLQDHNDAWIRVATELGDKCTAAALQQADIDSGAVDLFATTSITGLAVPSLESRIMNRQAFRSDCKRLPLFGLGCLGGAAGLARVADTLQGRPDQIGLLLSVELCSLTLQQEDLSVANIVSSGLFGDGSAAVVLAGAGHQLVSGRKKTLPQILATQSVLFPQTERIMGWDIVDTGFKVVLDPGVPEFAERHLSGHLQALLSRHSLQINDIDVWIAHPGGPKVIDAMESGLGLAAGTLDLSRQSLAEMGNLSSASVLNILDRQLEADVPAGSYGVLMAMGPGFSAEFLLLQWN
ncbi:MAG: hypothetical protein KDK39_06375 [Leptospiraceae bacterium]|nr:hypothetical protein [Leptospiraceae bacterium]